MSDEQDISYNQDSLEQRLPTAYEAWLGRVWQRMFQRERAAGPLMMNRDGHVVRQSWQVVDDRTERDCTPCCQ